MACCVIVVENDINHDIQKQNKLKGKNELSTIFRVDYTPVFSVTPFSLPMLTALYRERKKKKRK